jgi:hypothetical protein
MRAGNEFEGDEEEGVIEWERETESFVLRREENA